MSRWRWILLALLVGGLGCYFIGSAEPAANSNFHMIWEYGRHWGGFALLIAAFILCVGSFFAGESSLGASIAAVVIGLLCLLILANLLQKVMAR